MSGQNKRKQRAAVRAHAKLMERRKRELRAGQTLPKELRGWQRVVNT